MANEIKAYRETIVKTLTEESTAKVAQEHSQLNDDHVYLSLVDEKILVDPVAIVQDDASKKMLVRSYDEFYGIMFAIWDKLETGSDKSTFEDTHTSRDINEMLDKLTDEEITYAYNNLMKLVIESI